MTDENKETNKVDALYDAAMSAKDGHVAVIYPPIITEGDALNHAKMMTKKGDWDCIFGVSEELAVLREMKRDLKYWGSHMSSDWKRLRQEEIEERELIESIYAKSEKGVKYNHHPEWVVYLAKRQSEKIEREKYHSDFGGFKETIEDEVSHRITLAQDAANLLAETAHEQEHKEAVARELGNRNGRFGNC